MKKIFVSIGLAAAGAAGVPSVIAQGMEAGAAPKIWNVAANLRGFYDDNYAVAHNKTGSFGFEVSPSVSINSSFQQTDIGVRYTYGLYYYQQRAENGLNPIDNTHQGDFWVDHAFNERFKLNITDSFTAAQDPSLVQGGAVVRENGNNIANRATVTLNSEWTRQFSTATHYGNTIINYENFGTNSASNPNSATLLNRMEQNIGNDFQWHFQPETMGFIGYSFSWTRYTGNGEIAKANNVPPNNLFVHYYADSRNSDTHYAYVGVTEEFSPNLSGTARVGASYTDVYNDPVSPYTSLSPYADINATYTFMPGSYVQAGYTQNQNATDIATPSSSNGHLTAYQESSVFYADLNHRFSPKLTGSLTSQYQYSTYKEGAYSGKGDTSISAAINFNYEINRHLSANAGYNFSDLISSINNRGNNRNLVYIGLGATY